MAFQSRLTSLNADVAPLSKQVAVRDFLQTGSQRIAFALTTANLIQQSLQNEANADAAGDPTKFAELQAKLQMAVNVLGQEAQRGNMINQFVPNSGDGSRRRGFLRRVCLHRNKSGFR